MEIIMQNQLKMEDYVMIHAKNQLHVAKMENVLVHIQEYNVKVY